MNFFYVQDDMKPMQKLSVNIGLRYELVTPQFVSNNQLSNFDPSTNTMVLATSGSLYSRALVHTPKLNFAPRIGFAYQLDSKTVIRSAYGLSFEQFNREGGENLLAYNGPYIINSSITQVAPYSSSGDGVPPGALYRKQLPQLLPEPSNKVIRTGSPSPQYFNTQVSEVRYIPADIATGYVQSWHFDVQRELPSQTVMTVSYVGEHGVKIWTLADLNQGAPNLAGQTLSLQARRPIANFTAIEESLGGWHDEI